MSFFKKFTSALQNDKNLKINKSASLGNLKSPGPVHRPATPPLEDFITETLGTASVDLGASRVSSASLRKSRLSKTTKEVLHDPPALAYFIQYLEARDAVQLVKFWLDVEGFKSSAAAVISTPFVPDTVGACPQNQNELDRQVRETEVLPQSDSFDSGLGRQDLDLEADLGTEDEVEDKSVNDISSIVEHPTQEISRAAQIVKTRTEDAVKIYRRYIAPDSSRPLHLPTEFKKEIVERICAESGQVTADCFNNAQDKVVEVLESEYFPDFLKSEFHAKHLVDLLTGGQVLIADILYNDTALSHFMEFMENQSKRLLMEFWLTATNFSQSSRSDSSQGDAMVLYEKYFSMQATSPLGFSDSVRLQIENNICSDGGPDSSCFDLPLEIIVQYLETNYLQRFLISPMFKNYIKELIGTITASPRSLGSVTPGQSCGGSSAWSGRESDDRSDCSSEVSVQCNNNNSGVVRSSNTLLAMSSAPTSPEARNTDPGVEDTPDHPDKIWRRTPVRNEIGRMSSMGRYESGWALAPDTSRDQGIKQGSRISKAVKKLVMNEDHEKLKEEMAWQVAEMFVKEVTNVTMAEAETGVTRSTSLANNNYSLTDLSLDMDNLELPSAKYF